MIQLLTATGARPEAFALCERWMAAQTYVGEVVWIIVDDGQTQTPIHKHPKGWNQVVIRPAPYWTPGSNTQARNLQKGLAAVDDKLPLVIIEDDDYYAPDWLDTVTKALGYAELVGECKARYYNIAHRLGRQLKNNGHASLCSTAMRGAAIDTFRQACQRAPKFIDLELWRRHPSRYLFTGGRVVGIKGLPGRGGIGMGHRAGFQGTADPDLAILRSWIGDDVEAYREFC